MSTTTTETHRGLTAEQIELLLRMIAEGRVRQQKGNDHLEAWDIRRWLNRIFGFTGWSLECLNETLVHERIWPAKEEGKFRCTAVYRVRLRLHVRDVWGNELKFSDGAAVGESVNQPSIGDAHDMALKTADSQALKRCAIDLGDQFGLSLYDKNRRGSSVPVVQQTLGHPFAVQAAGLGDVPEDAPVTSGELDEQDDGGDAPAGPLREPPVARPKGAQRSAHADPGEWEQQAPGSVPLATDAQTRALGTLITKKSGPMTDAERYARLSQFTGREIASSKQLTRDEASRLIDWLGQQPDHVKPSEGARQAAAQAEAGLLAAGEPSAAERLESDLRDSIEAAADEVELTAVMKRAFQAMQQQRITLEQQRNLVGVAAVVRAGWAKAKRSAGSQLAGASQGGGA